MRKERNGYQANQGFVGFLGTVSFLLYVIDLLPFKPMMVWLSVIGLYLLVDAADNIARLYLEILNDNKKMISILDGISRSPNDNCEEEIYE